MIDIRGETLLRMAEELAQHSEEEGALTRVFLSPQFRSASALVTGWMREAGMAVRIDAIGNVIGRYEGDQPGLPALLIGSHLDTVRDAGKYDGMLGVITGIACVAELNRAGKRLPFAVEIIGFSDEEGVRFGSTLLGSKAIAGSFDMAALENTDALGVTLGHALREYGLNPDEIPQAAYDPDKALAYVELHIEQGPVLESLQKPVGIVTAIAGASRLLVKLRGEAGHAGTVPMTLRRDALAAAAEMILAVERNCAAQIGMVGTVGRIQAKPGAGNVIPGEVEFSIDMRCEQDSIRRGQVETILGEISAIAMRRNIMAEPKIIHQSNACACAPWLIEELQAAALSEGFDAAPLLASGAGHDAMAIAALCDVGMIFVRCKAGISHNPAESITAEDAEAGARVLLNFIENFRGRP